MVSHISMEMISTHAPHAGSDDLLVLVVAVLMYFNPRSPCGERRLGLEELIQQQQISTHAPHAGSDPGPQGRMDQSP